MKDWDSSALHPSVLSSRSLPLILPPPELPSEDRSIEMSGSHAYGATSHWVSAAAASGGASISNNPSHRYAFEGVIGAIRACTR